MIENEHSRAKNSSDYDVVPDLKTLKANNRTKNYGDAIVNHRIQVPKAQLINAEGKKVWVHYVNNL
jgi:hypothetical protein